MTQTLLSPNISNHIGALSPGETKNLGGPLYFVAGEIDFDSVQCADYCYVEIRCSGLETYYIFNNKNLHFFNLKCENLTIENLSSQGILHNFFTYSSPIEEAITDGTSTFYASNTITYGDLLILFFLILFIFAGIFKFFWNFFITAFVRFKKIESSPGLRGRGRGLRL